MAAVPTIGRASRIEGGAAPEADFTRALYEEYAPQIYRYCLHQLGSREEAEDAVQSTFLNAFRGIKRGVVPELESAWLFKIAHNVCLSRRRSSWRRGRIEAPTDFEIVEELAPAPSRRADELIGLQDVLEQMPEQQRRAILLREWQGLSYREISEELELSQAAVETLIFRARRALAQGLEEPQTVQKKKRRLGAGVLGNLISSAQSFLVGGGAAVKVAATVAVVSAGTVVATAPVQHHPAAPVRTHVRPAAKPVQAQPARAPKTPAPAVVVSKAKAPAPRPVRHHAAAPQHVAPVVVTPAVPDPAPVAPAATTTTAVTEPAPPAADAPPAGKSDAPGQQKKQEQQDATPSAPAASDNGHGNPNAPGQQKKQDGEQPAATSSSDQGHGNAGAPGQQKKEPQVVTPPLPATQAPATTTPDPATTPAPVPVAVDAPTAAPAVYLPPQQPQASDHGNGNGNGHNK